MTSRTAARSITNAGGGAASSPASTSSSRSSGRPSIERPPHPPTPSTPFSSDPQAAASASAGRSVAGEGGGILDRRRGGARLVGVLLRFSGQVVLDHHGEADVGGGRVEDPYLLVQRAGVDHLDQELGIGGGEEPEQPALVDAGARQRDRGAVPCLVGGDEAHRDREPAVARLIVDAQGGGAGDAAIARQDVRPVVGQRRPVDGAEPGDLVEARAGGEAGDSGYAVVAGGDVVKDGRPLAG